MKSIVINFEARDIKGKDERYTHYNHIAYEFKAPLFGIITHIVEKYDDVCDCPVMQLAMIVDGELEKWGHLESTPIDTTKLNTGGVYYEVEVDEDTLADIFKRKFNIWK